MVFPLYLYLSLYFLRQEQELELDEFITHRMGFDEINRALNLLAQGKCLRCIIWMDDGAAKEDGA